METSSLPNNPAPQGLKRWLAIPEIPRALPFILFVGLGSLQGKFFEGSEYWIYAAKTILVAGVLWSLRGYIAEMKWAFSWEGLGVGVIIAGLWIGIDGWVPSLNEIWNMATGAITGESPKPTRAEPPWNPLVYFSDNVALAWTFVATRVIGRSLVVPMVEEVFYRSFFYRSIAGVKFNQVPLGRWHTGAFLVTSIVFGLAHPGQWLPAIVCGAAYQLLVIRKKRLGDAMLAHGTTNLLISVYAIATGRWHFT